MMVLFEVTPLKNVNSWYQFVRFLECTSKWVFTHTSHRELRFQSTQPLEARNETHGVLVEEGNRRNVSWWFLCSWFWFWISSQYLGRCWYQMLHGGLWWLWWLLLLLLLWWWWWWWVICRIDIRHNHLPGPPAKCVNSWGHYEVDHRFFLERKEKLRFGAQSFFGPGVYVVEWSLICASKCGRKRMYMMYIVSVDVVVLREYGPWYSNHYWCGIAWCMMVWKGEWRHTLDIFK